MQTENIENIIPKNKNDSLVDNSTQTVQIESVVQAVIEKTFAENATTSTTSNKLVMRKIRTQTKSDSLKDHIGGEDIHEDIQDVFEHSENPDNINEMFSVVSFTGMFLFANFCNSFSREQEPFCNNFGSTIYYNSSFKNSCDTKLIQCGNEKRREKEKKKFTNSYELQKIKGEIILQLDSLGKFQLNSLMARNFLTH